MLLEKGVCYDQCVLLAKLHEPLPCFILYPKAKFACYSRYLLTSYFYIQVPYNEKDIFWGVLVVECLVGLHRTIQVQLFQHYWWGRDLDYCDTEWFSLETNRDHLSVLRLHPSTAFRSLSLTMMTTTFLLRDSCPQ